jgi:hypothetical protein
MSLRTHLGRVMTGALTLVALAGCDKMEGASIEDLEGQCFQEDCPEGDVDAEGEDPEQELPEVDLDPDPLYLDRATRALEAWDIALDTEQMTALRALGDAYTAHNPPNWVTVSDETCGAEGVGEGLRADCPLGGDVIGVCETRFYPATGEIVDTTLVVLDAFQESPASEQDKRAVFTHELGHCLGLRHSGSEHHVMYPTTAGADAPANDEQHALETAYHPHTQAPPPGIAKKYFSVTTGGDAIRHFEDPVFVLSGSMGTESGRSYELPATGRALTDDVAVARHLIQRDGGCGE